MNKKTILIIGIALALAPIFASAQTLTASVSGNAVSVASPVMASPCAAFNRSLHVGTSGSDVTSLQFFLSARGYLKVSPTGYFGPLTREAVASWQADGSVAVQGSAGSGIFGPLSRAYFARSCGDGTLGIRPGFYANPQSGEAPLTVQFTSSEPAGTALGNSVDFGDGSTRNLGFIPTCSQCNPTGTVSHTYTTPGTYTATLTSGSCACPAGGVCNCPMISVLATTTVTISPTSTTMANIQQVQAPASVALGVGSIAEVRNEHYYFTLQSISASSATIQLTSVGCWNSFPSDPPPQIVCMIAVFPIPPQTLSVGQSYKNGNFNMSLTALSSTTATFSVGTP